MSARVISGRALYPQLLWEHPCHKLRLILGVRSCYCRSSVAYLCFHLCQGIFARRFHSAVVYGAGNLVHSALPAPLPGVLGGVSVRRRVTSDGRCLPFLRNLHPPNQVAAAKIWSYPSVKHAVCSVDSAARRYASRTQFSAGAQRLMQPQRIGSTAYCGGTIYDNACETAGLDFHRHFNTKNSMKLPASAEELKSVCMYMRDPQHPVNSVC